MRIKKLLAVAAAGSALAFAPTAASATTAHPSIGIGGGCSGRITTSTGGASGTYSACISSPDQHSGVAGDGYAAFSADIASCTITQTIWMDGVSPHPISTGQFDGSVQTTSSCQVNTSSRHYGGPTGKLATALGQSLYSQFCVTIKDRQGRTATGCVNSPDLHII
jgi:hypothetical protein